MAGDLEALGGGSETVRRGLAGKVVGGLFNTHLTGTGWVALVLVQPLEGGSAAAGSRSSVGGGLVDLIFGT